MRTSVGIGDICLEVEFLVKHLQRMALRWCPGRLRIGLGKRCNGARRVSLVLLVQVHAVLRNCMRLFGREQWLPVRPLGFVSRITGYVCVTWWKVHAVGGTIVVAASRCGTSKRTRASLYPGKMPLVYVSCILFPVICALPLELATCRRG